MPNPFVHACVFVIATTNPAKLSVVNIALTLSYRKKKKRSFPLSNLFMKEELNWKNSAVEHG